MRLVIERTEGNPFFMEEMIQELFEEQALVRNGAVRLTRPLSEFRVPPTVQAILAARIDRLPSEGKDLLQTLAVIGKEFSLRLVRAVWQTLRSIDDSDEAATELEGGLADLQLAEFIYEQPAVDDLEYTFKHALTQEVAYGSVLVERRKLLHERIGAALELTFAQSIDDHLTELAHHYGRSGNARKAAQFLTSYAELATRRLAYREAAESLERGLELIRRLPADRERDRDELKLQAALINCTSPIQGPGSAEVRAAIERSLQLSRQLDDRDATFRALVSLRLSYMFWDLRKARDFGEQTAEIAKELGDATMDTIVQAGMGQVLLYQGEVANSRDYLQKCLGARQSASRLQEVAYFASFPRVIFQGLLAWNLWLLGYPDQSHEKVRDTLALAKSESNEYLRMAGEFNTLYALVVLRDEQILGYVDSLLARAVERGYSVLVTIGRFLQAWILAERGEQSGNVGEMERTLSEAPLLWAGWFNILLAETYGKSGRATEGLSRLEVGSRIVSESGAELFLAESHRVQAELLLIHDQENFVAAERSFRAAIDSAARQQAKSWELRAVSGLARLLASRGRREEARARLADIYRSFTEGFDTPDLKEAKALLDH